MENPFYITGIIPEAYFCDRAKETQWLVKTLTNKAHVLLTSPRRMGKTQLIYHVFEQPEIKNQYYTFYTDIYPTTSLEEMVFVLSKAIYGTLVPKGKTALDRFFSVLRSLAGSIGYDPVSCSPSFDIKLGDIESPALTLEEIFHYLENADKSCIFAIDEFQQIANYPQKNVEALLRTHIQKMNNCCFIFAGSNRHILENMFNSAAKPFYNSAQQLYLDTIPKATYAEFAKRQFAQAGRRVHPDAIALAYDLFEGHTYYIHSVLHNAFAYLPADQQIDFYGILDILYLILEEKERGFADIMNQLNYQQKEVIIAIAQERKASGVTSVAFVRKYALKSPSSVQYAIRTLLERQLITYENEGRAKVYSVTDRFMGEWIRETY